MSKADENGTARNMKTVRAQARHGLRNFASDSGIAAIEFAFLAPVLVLLFAGICQFSLVLSNYLTLEHAVHAGARTMAISRGDATPVTDARTQILSAAGNLTQANIIISYSVNGSACSTNVACGSALQAGLPSTVAATYPCSLVVFGKDFLPGCTLSVQTTERVE